MVDAQAAATSEIQCSKNNNIRAGNKISNDQEVSFWVTAFRFLLAARNKNQCLEGLFRAGVLQSAIAHVRVTQLGVDVSTDVDGHGIRGLHPKMSTTEVKKGRESHR